MGGLELPALGRRPSSTVWGQARSTGKRLRASNGPEQFRGWRAKLRGVPGRLRVLLCQPYAIGTPRDRPWRFLCRKCRAVISFNCLIGLVGAQECESSDAIGESVSCGESRQQVGVAAARICEWGKRRKANIALLPRTIDGVAMRRCTEPLSSCVRSTTTGLKPSHRIERPVHSLSRGPANASTQT
jgi:hypothetical protein